MSTLAPRLIVHVTQQGASWQLIGRAAALAAWIAVYAEEINSVHRGTIAVDWEGPALRPQLHKKFDRINTDNLMPMSDQSST